MAYILIKDLSENVELDRQAMATIAGGARIGGSSNLQWRRPYAHIVKRPADSAAKPAAKTTLLTTLFK